MPQQTLNVGTAPDAADGDNLRTANQKANANFDELYQLTGNLPTNRGQGGLYGIDSDIYGIPGMTIRSVTTAVNAYVANRVYMVPWLLPFPITLQKVRAIGADSSSASDVQLGIAKASEDGTYFSLEWEDTINVPLTTPAARDISSIALDLDPGFYYILSKAETGTVSMTEPFALSSYCEWTAANLNRLFFRLYGAGSAGSFTDPVVDPTNLTVGADATKGLALPFLMQWDSRAQDWS